jgi:hypothetical protein
MYSQVRPIIRVRETTRYEAIFAECEGSSPITCGFCDVHKYVLCEFVYRRIWNHMRSRIPERCTINCWRHSQKGTHLSLYTGNNSWTTDFGKSVVSLSWQLFDMWCRLLRSLGKLAQWLLKVRSQQSLLYALRRVMERLPISRVPFQPTRRPVVSFSSFSE